MFLVTGQHLLVARVGGGGRNAAPTQLQLVDLGDLGQQNRLDRIGEMVVKPGLRGVQPAPEAQHHALFVRLHLVNAGTDPRHRQESRNQQQSPALEVQKGDQVVGPVSDLRQAGGRGGGRGGRGGGLFNRHRCLGSVKDHKFTQHSEHIGNTLGPLHCPGVAYGV